MNLVVVDTETSDLPANGGQLLELAWIVLEYKNAIWVPVRAEEKYVQYMGPISVHALAIHHIKADQLTSAGGAVTREQAILTLLQDLQQDSFIVAHNADFDAKFLPEISTPWICTMRISKAIWPEAPGHSNQVLRYWLGVEPDLTIASQIRHRNPHEALYDAATTAGILRKMLERHTPQELHNMSKNPVRLKTISFGKHRGTAFDAIPLDYLHWLRRTNNLDQDVKFTIDDVLKGAP